jgi:C1A family cysteine protease
MLNYKLTYKFQEKDSRDYTFTTILDPTNNKLELTTIVKKGIQNLKTTNISPTNFVINNLPSILDQGNYGSCVANAFSFTVSKQTNNGILLSRFFLYNISRSIDFCPLNKDNGTTIRSTCDAIKSYGVCKETDYPYISSNLILLPSLSAFQNSKRFKTFTYLFVNQNLSSIKKALIMYNSPIIFGMRIYSSFMSSTNGKIPLPNFKKDRVLGGHCITIVGYDDTTQMFKCSNSWGKAWGSNGYCYIPYAYILNPTLARDFCVATFIY